MQPTQISRSLQRLPSQPQVRRLEKTARSFDARYPRRHLVGDGETRIHPVASKVKASCSTASRQAAVGFGSSELRLIPRVYNLNKIKFIDPFVIGNRSSNGTSFCAGKFCVIRQFCLNLSNFVIKAVFGL